MLSITNFIYLTTIPVIYTNIYTSHATKFINFMYITNLFLNYNTILLDVVDKYFRIKYYVKDIYNNKKKTINELLYKIGYYKDLYFEYELINAELYTNLSNKINIKTYINNNKINIINKKTFFEIYNYYNIDFINNKDIRIRLNFKFCDKEYILFIPYKYRNIIYNRNDKNHDVPYPPFTNEIMEKYKNNMIESIHKDFFNKKSIYSYLLLNFKNIDFCKIYNKNNSFINIKEYIEKINTPFNDMGLLYSCLIPVSWICIENYVNINNFNKIYLKYTNYYFNEDKMELRENFFEKNDIDDIFISDILEEYIINNNIDNNYNINNSDNDSDDEDEDEDNEDEDDDYEDEDDDKIILKLNKIK